MLSRGGHSFQSEIRSFVRSGVFSASVFQTRGGEGGGRRGGIKFRGVVFFFFSEIWVDLLECSLFHFFFYFYLTFSPYIIVYHYTVIILYQINYSFVDIYLQSAFLEVVIPPDIISEETSNDLMVPEGGSAKLVCKARGYPKPDIVWKREDGAEIISRAGLSGGKTKSEYNYISIVIYFRSPSKCTLLHVCEKWWNKNLIDKYLSIHETF